MATSLVSTPDPIDLLPKVLQDVRAGRFTPNLMADARLVYAQRAIFSANGDEVALGRAHSLLWEIYDQAGMYDEALAVIKTLSDTYLDEFTKAELQDSLKGEAPEKNREIARQKIMCCLAYGFALYRKRQYSEARIKLDQCETFLTKFLIDARPDSPFYCWGALARLHYFYGQVLRAEGDYVQARQRFTRSLENIWNRLREKKERPSPLPSEKLVVEQLFANHCAGKVLAFGFGWTSQLQGELSRAQEFFQSARVLLADSADDFLVWQVELFFCMVLRVKDGSLADLGKLLARMKQCSEKLKPHPEYYLQSLRHLAMAHLSAARALPAADPARGKYLDEGNRSVREAQALPLCSHIPEYRMQAKIVASRLVAERGKAGAKLSLRLAEEADACARDENLPPRVQAEAHIALAETRSLGSERSDWKAAVALLQQALTKSGGNRVVRCACHLHLTELHLKLTDIPSAVSSFADWQAESLGVEHDWLTKKATFLREQVNKCKLFLVPEGDTRDFYGLSQDLAQFLVDREKLRLGENFNAKDAAQNIGIDARTFQSWMDKIDQGEPIKLQLRKR